MNAEQVLRRAIADKDGLVWLERFDGPGEVGGGRLVLDLTLFFGASEIDDAEALVRALGYAEAS